MQTALYAGSFDPFTNGHLDIVEQASKIFDKVFIAVGNNSEKQCFLPVEKRLELIKNSTLVFDNIEVVSYEGLTVEFAKHKGVDVLVRGVRNSSDFEYEKQIADTNRLLAPEIETILLTPRPENAYISSTIVREIYANGGDISKFVPCVW